MQGDGMMFLVVIGLGGFVLWYLMKQPAERPVTTQQQPCSVSGSYAGYGLNFSCGAIEKIWDKVGEGLETVGRYGSVSGSAVGTVLFGSSGEKVSAEEFERRTGCKPTGNIADMLACGLKDPLKSETQSYNGPLNLRIGKPVGSVPPPVPVGPPKPPPASKAMGFR